MRNRGTVRQGFAVAGFALAATRLASAAPPDTYGTTSVSYVRVPAIAFLPINSSTPYTTSGRWLLWGDNDNSGFAAPLTLPSGAKVVTLRFDFRDLEPSNSLFASLDVCDSSGEECARHPLAGAGPADCRIAGLICSGDAFVAASSSETADLSADDIVIDNLNRSYVLQTYMEKGDGSQRIAALVVGYVLQVSPAPATATFNDVPTGHPFFQFVEALAASGITAGCGGDNFCPDAPLTRGQMAAFLAKALGLQWPVPLSE